MFCSSTVLVALLAASAQLVAANTPSCLLAAINTQDNPSDVQAICKNAQEVESYISSNCGNNVQAAMAGFKSVCQGAGVSVAAYSASSPSSGTGSATASATGGKISATSTIVYTSHYYDSSCSCTKAATMTGTAYIGPSGIVTGTSGSNSTSPAQNTAAASSSAAASSGTAASSAAASGSSGSSSTTGSAVPSSTGAAGRIDAIGLSMGALAFAGLAVVL